MFVVTDEELQILIQAMVALETMVGERACYSSINGKLFRESMRRDERRKTCVSGDEHASVR